MTQGTLVLGAGFGGISAALELRRLAPREPVTLVDAADTFTMGLVNLWALDGRTSGTEHARPLRALEKHGVGVVKATVERIDPVTREVVTSAGALRGDRLVVALGARADLDGLQGAPPHARNLYALAGARAFHEDLTRLRGGRALILVMATPFKCPPAPYEAAALAKAFLDGRGAGAEVLVATPEPHPLPAFPPEVGGHLRKLVEERGVVVRNGATVARFEDRAVVLADGTRLEADALAIVPPHKLPPAAAALAGPSGWIEVDPRTLSSAHADVWAVGDCAALALPGRKPIPKAGVLAEGEGLVVARRIAQRLQGKPEDATFDGRGTCYIELGGGLAVEGRGDFFASPHPMMHAGEPSAGSMRAKEAFMQERLDAWFGA